MEETFIDGTLTFQRDTHFSFFAGRYTVTGGSFHEIAGTVRRVDTVNKLIVLGGNEKVADGATLKLEDVVNIDGEVFNGLEEYSS